MDESLNLPTASPDATKHINWGALGFVCIGALALAVLQLNTLSFMVEKWIADETYTHGFLILPISLWLIWERRALIALTPWRPDWRIALLTLPVSAVWYVASAVDVQIVQQLAFVATLVVLLWSVLGRPLCVLLKFPLFFMFFMVPIGEGLVPPMMEFTADSTVWLIQRTGIPVYRDGLFFSLPSGNWSVVDACSGVRYIIASVTLGVIYAYLSYTSLKRRLLFVLASALLPVLANTLRAYGIVMLAHYTNGALATGVDHLVYGWVFFGVVVGLLFWLGSFFSEPELQRVPVSPNEQKESATKAPLSPTIGASLALLVALAPVVFATLGSNASASTAAVAAPPDFVVSGEWRPSSLEMPWEYALPARVEGRRSALLEGPQGVALIEWQYSIVEGASKAGQEVIGSVSLVDSPDQVWRLRDWDGIQLEGDTVLGKAFGATVGTGSRSLKILSVYTVGGYATSNDVVAKLLEALVRLGLLKGEPMRLAIVAQLDVSDLQLLDLLRRNIDSLGTGASE